MATNDLLHIGFLDQLTTLAVTKWEITVEIWAENKGSVNFWLSYSRVLCIEDDGCNAEGRHEALRIIYSNVIFL